MTEILDKIVDIFYATHVPALFLSALYPVHCPQCSAPGLIRCLAGGDLLRHALFDMKAQFFLQLLLDLYPPKDGAYSKRNCIQPMFQTHSQTSALTPLDAVPRQER